MKKLFLISLIIWSSCALAQDISNPQTNASALTSGTLPAGRLPALSGDVTSSAGSAATTLAAGSASNLNSGTLAAARGGAGTINGALAGNGSGVVSQSACAGLSNAAASCSTDATNATNITSGTLPNARIVALPNANLANSSITIGGIATALGGSYAPARTTSQPSNPTGTTSTTPVMMGLAGTITPVTSGNVLITISGQMSNSLISDGCINQITTGTGSAPTNGAAATGTTAGTTQAGSGAAAAQSLPFSLTAYITGLTLSTARWIDLRTGAVTAGTCNLFVVNIVAVEL